MNPETPHHQMPPLRAEDVQMSPLPPPSAWWGVLSGVGLGMLIGMSWWALPEALEIPRPTSDRGTTAAAWVLWSNLAVSPIIIGFLVAWAARPVRRAALASMSTSVPVTLFFISLF